MNAIRRVAAALPDAEIADAQAALELTTAAPLPRLISAAVVEGSTLTARRLADPPTVGIAAFLDGVQQSQIVAHLPGGVPIVLGTVAAVIRERRTARMCTWSHAVERRLYVSRAHVSPRSWQHLAAADLELHDTGDADASSGAEHPLALRESAVHRVQAHRESIEQRLARAWIESEDRPLLVDGGIASVESVPETSHAIGMIKSHRTMYATGAALTTVLALGLGERSSAFLVTSPKRATVCSWYLRLRASPSSDPMWGLVRVEVPASAAGADVGPRADEVSRWILAEAAPVSLPDRRWDTMLYGVRDCEQFLRAVM